MVNRFDDEDWSLNLQLEIEESLDEEMHRAPKRRRLNQDFEEHVNDLLGENAYIEG